MNLSKAISFERTKAKTEGTDLEVVQRILSRNHCTYDPEIGRIIKSYKSPEFLMQQHIEKTIAMIGKHSPQEGTVSPEEELEFLKDPVYREKRLKVLKMKVLNTTGDEKDVSAHPHGSHLYTKVEHLYCPTSHVVWLLETGVVPKKLSMKDWDYTNTRFSNLLSHDRQPSVKMLQCVVTHDNRQYSLGSFATPEEVTAKREEFEFLVSIGLHDMLLTNPIGRERKVKSGGFGAGSLLKPYQCVVVYGGRQYHLGRFNTREEVRKAREDFRTKKSIGLI